MAYEALITLAFQTIVTGILLGLAGVSLNLLYSVTRLVNIATGEFIMIGAYITYWSYTQFSLSPMLSHIFVWAFFAILGLAAYRLFFYRLTRLESREKIEIISLLTFFAIIIVSQNFIILRFTSIYRGYSFLMETINVFGVNIAYNKLLLIVLGLLAMLALYSLLNTGRIGLAIKATIQNRTAAELVGIDIRFIDSIVVALSFGLAGLGGSLLSMTLNFDPYIGLYYTISALIVMVLGGVGNMAGTIIGGMLMGAINAVGSYYVSSGVALAITYGIFFTILLLRPRGLFRGVA
ncbi:MAG: branched-chain amino acid ABC transporter permease [Nitrososphaerota archaeon]